MTINQLPEKSRARRLLKPMTYSATKERLRCAQAALDMALWCHDKYPDEPAQWIRAEQLLKDILKDNAVRIEWWLKPTPPSAEGG